MKNTRNLKAKIAKSVLAGTCFTLISAGSAFAAESEDMAATLAYSPESVIMNVAAVSTLPEPTTNGAAVSYIADPAISAEDAALMAKHQEIDDYIFNQGGLEKFREAGFTVTHTGPIDGVIEIGITPYDESHAAELYALFGKEQVRVVEGVQAMPFIATDDGAGVSPEGQADDGAFTTFVVGGPQPGEGEVAITTVGPDTPVSSGDVATGAIEDGGEVPAVPEGGNAATEAQPISAPVDLSDSDVKQASSPWLWAAGAAAVLAAAALFARKVFAVKK
jgi:hypothetical protein